MPLRVWKFLENQKNREVLTWLGGGASAGVVAAWGIFVYVFPHDDGKTSGQIVKVVSDENVAE
jgi:hypothetical protein